MIGEKDAQIVVQSTHCLLRQGAVAIEPCFLARQPLAQARVEARPSRCGCAGHTSSGPSIDNDHDLGYSYQIVIIIARALHDALPVASSRCTARCSACLIAV